MPRLALEVVSKTYGGEYERKRKCYIDLGIRYYAVYSPVQRRGRDPLEVYELVNGEYKRLQGEPVWLSEIGLGLGRDMGRYNGWQREWLYWYDESGKRLLTPEENAEHAQAAAAQAQTAATQSEAKAARLAAKLRELGINPDEI